MPAGKPCLGPVPGCLDGATVSWAAPASPDTRTASPMPEAASATTAGEGRLLMFTKK